MSQFDVPQPILQMARNNLLSYSKLQSPWLQVADHTARIANLLMKVESGEIKRLILSAPPRHGKTTLVGQHLPPWYMGRNPDKKVIYSTYGQSLSSAAGMLVKDQVLQPNYEKLFGGMKLSNDSKAKNLFHLNKDGQRTRGGYLAVGRGGAVTGKGGHLIIIDDLLKDYKEAMSETIREECIEYWKNTLSTRMEEDASVIVMATRWHKRDLIGYLLSEERDEKWVVANFPAINENGEALWPEKYPIKFLNKQKKRMGREFSSLYMGDPVEKDGNIFKTSFFNNRFDTSIKYERKDIMIQVWDTTFKEEGSSYVVGQCWHQKGNQFYLRDQVRGKWGFSATCTAMEAFYKKWPEAYLCYLENKANGEAIKDYFTKGQGYIQNNKKNPIAGLKLFDPGRLTKLERADSTTVYYEVGNVLFPEHAKWLQDYIDEHLSFPVGENDDQVDVSSSALILLNKRKQAKFAAGEQLGNRS